MVTAQKNFRTPAWLSVAVVAVSLIALRVEGSELRKTAFVQAFQRVSDSVVSIQGLKTVRTSPDATAGEFKQVNGMGTGVIIDERGYIITNHHVVEGVSRIQVTFAKGRTVVGRVVAHDRPTDLAIIHIKTGQPLPIIPLGRSADILMVEPVMAIGNAYGYEHTVTRGIISGKFRNVQVSDTQKYRNLLQTDASINPGNSGGPLINIDGQMIGLNVAVRQGAQGIGFAIPVDDVMETAARLIRADQESGLFHGIVAVTDYKGNEPRVTIKSVLPNSPADEGGLKPGDVVTSFNGKTINRLLDFERSLLNVDSNTTLKLNFERSGVQRDAELALQARRNAPAKTGDRNLEQLTWSRLGLRLEKVSDRDFQHARYNGGLRVVEVRPNSPASLERINTGDVLVGMQDWETLSLENVAYVLRHTDTNQRNSVKFFILRRNQTLYGYLRLASRP